MQCPKCGSELREGLSFCPHCGEVVKNKNEKVAQTSAGKQTVSKPKKKRSAWFWIFAIMFFPITLTVLIVKSKKMDVKVKVALIAILWILVFVIGSSEDGGTTDSQDPSGTTEQITTEIQNDTEAEKNNSEQEVDNSENETSFNEQFINTYIPMGVPCVIEEYKKLEEAGDYDLIKSLMYRNHQEDENIPVLEEQTVTGEAIVISAGSGYSDEGTTKAELYLGEYDFEYDLGLIPAKEKLLEEHPEEWNKFVSITSAEYMKVNNGDVVIFEGKIYGFEHDYTMVIKGTCSVK